MKLSLGVIGIGYWNHYVRLIFEHHGCELVAVCDLKRENLDKIREKYPPTLLFTTNYESLYSECDAVIICTPSSTHYKIAKDCLENGLHVLIEKPMAETVEQCDDLISIAKEKNVTLLIGHTYEYNTYTKAVKEALLQEVIGDVKYCTFNRVGNSPRRSDVNAAIDLMTHDFSMAINWFGMPTTIQSFGKAFLQEGIEDVAFVICEWENEIIAQFTSSWINPKKERRISIIGKEGMLVFDDVEKSVVFTNDYVLTGIINPEPLWRQVSNFIASINGQEEVEVTGEKGREVVRLLEACNKSLNNNGEKVYL